MQICMHSGMALAKETRGLPKLGCTPSQEQSLLLSWGTLFSVHAYRSSPGRQCLIKPPLNVGLYLRDRKVYFQCLFLCIGSFALSEDWGRIAGRCNWGTLCAVQSEGLSTGWWQKSLLTWVVKGGHISLPRQLPPTALWGNTAFWLTSSQKLYTLFTVLLIPQHVKPEQLAFYPLIM